MISTNDSGKIDVASEGPTKRVFTLMMVPQSVTNGKAQKMVDAAQQDVPRIPLVPLDVAGDTGEAENLGGGGQRPVVFVHGFLGSAGQFDTMKERFQAAGYDTDLLMCWPYETSWDPFTKAGQRTLTTLGKALAWAINDKYGTTTRVDIVAHSMGSLVSRAAVKYGDYNDHIDPLLSQVVHCVSLAGPNHGAKNEWLKAFGVVIQGQIGDMVPDSPFLRGLNQSPEVSSGTKWLTYRTPGDEEVDEDSVPLQGADNRRIDLRSGVPGGGSDPIHNSFLTNQEVANNVVDFLKPPKVEIFDPVSDKGSFQMNFVTDDHKFQVESLWMVEPGTTGSHAYVSEQRGENMGNWTYQWYADDVHPNQEVYNPRTASTSNGIVLRIRGANGYHKDDYIGRNSNATGRSNLVCTGDTSVVKPDEAYFLLLKTGWPGWRLYRCAKQDDGSFWFAGEILFRDEPHGQDYLGYPYDLPMGDGASAGFVQLYKPVDY
ncbi:esterase/lipase family protein [Streptomyces microflavus]|uniref:esterase/lipase family protein n=1 Tax=Streptomyces microflavus TaxID=1919 RepID=UPI0035E33618